MYFSDSKTYLYWAELSAEKLIKLEDLVLAGKIFRWNGDTQKYTFNPAHISYIKATLREED